MFVVVLCTEDRIRCELVVVEIGQKDNRGVGLEWSSQKGISWKI